MRVLVDSDVFAYSCGFAAQKKVYFTEEPEIVAEPVENALSLAKTALTAIYDEVDTWLKKSGEKCDQLELFLTGKENFRDKIATIRVYKGNRIGKPKPVHYQAIRDYLVDFWGATVVNGYEADDQLSIEAHKEGYDADRVMICSVDKDLRTVPGLLYSFKKKESELLTEQEALVNFYRQCITGDSADNILGCFRAGEKAAGRIHDGLDEHGMWVEVIQQFSASVEHKKCPYTDYYAAAVETAQLLWLLREPSKIWQPPC